MTPIRVALVEDHAAFRESLADLLRETPGFTCVGACADARTALDRLPAIRPDVILMDLHLPGENGLECIRGLRERLPETPILMLTVEEHSGLVFAALRAGASGYLVKAGDSAVVLEAIREARAGGAPMSAPIARLVVQSFHERSPGSLELADLTRREAEILELVANGWTSKETAGHLDVSIFTVQTHLRHIYEKLHVRSRTAAAAKWMRR
ncbi:MAG: response regulator transcription factor [Verrucomicrobia bacterium]|nr:response regulator transcription factor [Verrucomicrobiota bacterium]